MTRTKSDPNNMSFLDHLEEFRWALIRAIVGILIAATIVLFFTDIIFDLIIFGPKNKDFITYQVLCDIGRLIAVESEFCDPQLDFMPQSRKMSDLFSVHIWTSITIGFVVAFPWVLWQFWRFISPGLKDHERKYSRGFIIVSSLLFFVGVVFGYFLIAPLSVHFLATYDLSNGIKFEPDIQSYIALIRASVLASGLMFELPVIVYFLTKIGLCTPQAMRKYRKYALIIILIVAALITPPDIQSQVIVAIPVLILYELSVFISMFVLRKQNKASNKLTK